MTSPEPDPSERPSLRVVEDTDDRWTVPADTEAEQQILGAFMLAPHRLADVEDQLSVEHFYRPVHQTLWQELVAAHRAGHPLDAIGMNSWLTQRGKASMVDAPYLHTLVATVAVIDGALALIPRLEELRLRRHLIGTALHLDQVARTQGSDLTQGVERVTRMLDEPRASSTEWTTPADATPTMLERITTPDTLDSRVLPTGLASLDKLLVGGLRAGQLVTIGAYTSVGKSLVVTNIARYVAFDRAGVVAFFSQEMNDDEVMDRLLAARYGIPHTAITSGTVSEAAVASWLSDIDNWDAARLHVEDSTRVTVTSIGAACRRLKHTQGRLDLIVVDHLHLVTSENPREKRHLQLGEMTAELKRLAGELGCPVVLACQLNRESAKGDRPPVLTDLRESGAIEQDSAIVLLLNREKVEGVMLDEMHVQVAKQRGGPLGHTKLRVEGSFARISDGWPSW